MKPAPRRALLIAALLVAAAAAAVGLRPQTAESAVPSFDGGTFSEQAQPYRCGAPLLDWHLGDRLRDIQCRQEVRPEAVIAVGGLVLAAGAAAVVIGAGRRRHQQWT